MRKKGKNSSKCVGKSALPPDENNGFTIDRDKENCERNLAENLLCKIKKCMSLTDNKQDT
jgi:hypothetical protein